MSFQKNLENSHLDTYEMTKLKKTGNSGNEMKEPGFFKKGKIFFLSV